MADPTYRGGAFGGAANGGSFTFNVAAGASGHLADDLQIVAAVVGSPAPDATSVTLTKTGTGADFTLVSTETVAMSTLGQNAKVFLFQRVLTGAEPSGPQQQILTANVNAPDGTFRIAYASSLIFRNASPLRTTSAFLKDEQPFATAASITSAALAAVRPASFPVYLGVHLDGSTGSADPVDFAAGPTVIHRIYSNSTLNVLTAYGSAVGVGGATPTARLFSPGSNTAQAVALKTLLIEPGNSPPDAPILLSPANGEALNRDAVNRFSRLHADPDNDGASRTDYRHRLVGASSWTVTTVNGPNNYVDFAAGIFAVGSFEWQARTYDTAGLVGAWSSSGFFSAATVPAGPAITAPVNGETIGQASATLTWTAAAQDAYQVRKVADAAGTADTSSVLYDSGEVVAADTRSVTLTFDVNSRYEHVQVRVKDEGLFSPWTSVRVLVSYTLPATALLSVVPDEARYALAVQVVNPTPTNGQPVRSFNRIYVTALTPGDMLRPMGVRKLAASQFVGTLFLDDRVASGVDYAYEVQTVAINGTASMSALVSDYRDLGVTPGGNEYDAATFDSAVLG